MKTLLTLALVALMAGSAFAQLDNSMGLFFVDSGFENPDNARANTNFDTVGAPVMSYVCVLSTTMYSIGAYELGVAFSDPSVLIIGLTGPNGFTNYGDNFNHRAGYVTPLPSSAGYALLSTMTLFYTGSETVDIVFGPSQPNSVGDAGPAIVDGTNADIVYVCNYTSGEDMGGLVATLNGDGIEFPGGVATEAHSLSAVKALFN